MNMVVVDMLVVAAVVFVATSVESVWMLRWLMLLMLVVLMVVMVLIFTLLTKVTQFKYRRRFGFSVSLRGRQGWRQCSRSMEGREGGGESEHLFCGHLGCSARAASK